MECLVESEMDGLFQATVEATEEVVINSLSRAKTMVGRDGNVSHALPLERVMEIIHRYGRSEFEPGAPQYLDNCLASCYDPPKIIRLFPEGEMIEARVERFACKVDLEGRWLKPEPHKHAHSRLSFWVLLHK